MPEEVSLKPHISPLKSAGAIGVPAVKGEAHGIEGLGHRDRVDKQVAVGREADDGQPVVVLPDVGDLAHVDQLPAPPEEGAPVLGFALIGRNDDEGPSP